MTKPTAKPTPIGIAVQRTVCSAQCDLRPSLRHVAMVLATLGNRQTGRGFASQETIALATGYSERTIRGLMAELELTAPIYITRRARMRRDGRGRTSDEYRLILWNQPAAGSGKTGTTNRQEGPEGQHEKGDDQPEADARPTGSKQHDQPAAGSGDPVRDPVSTDPVSISPLPAAANGAFALSAPEPSAKKAASRKKSKAKKAGSKAEPKPKKKAEPKRTPEQHAAHAAVVAAHVAIVREATGVEPAEEHGPAWKLLDGLKGDREQAIARIREAVSRGEFGTTSLAKIAGKPNDYIPRRNGGRGQQQGPKQPNSGWTPPMENL